ncbi:MAG: trypsin-like peptidase domain-containing protein [Aminipila sp.]
MTAYGASYTLTDANVTVNTNGVQVQCLPMSLNGTTYLPLRNVAEALGADVNYNNTTKQINLTTLDVNKLAESCVMLYAENGTKGHQGSGVYIDYGTILTCDHVTTGSTKQFTSDKLNLTLGESNPSLDASILYSPNKDIKPVKIGDSDELKQDSKVVVITSPLNQKNKVAYGLLMEDCTPGKTSVKLWADTDHGSSGGAVFNMNGELVGIMATASDTQATSGKACTMIPINEIRKAL